MHDVLEATVHRFVSLWFEWLLQINSVPATNLLLSALLHRAEHVLLLSANSLKTEELRMNGGRDADVASRTLTLYPKWGILAIFESSCSLLWLRQFFIIPNAERIKSLLYPIVYEFSYFIIEKKKSQLLSQFTYWIQIKYLYPSEIGLDLDSSLIFATWLRFQADVTLSICNLEDIEYRWSLLFLLSISWAWTSYSLEIEIHCWDAGRNTKL